MGKNVRKKMLEESEKHFVFFRLFYYNAGLWSSEGFSCLGMIWMTTDNEIY